MNGDDKVGALGHAEDAPFSGHHRYRSKQMLHDPSREAFGPTLSILAEEDEKRRVGSQDDPGRVGGRRVPRAWGGQKTRRVDENQTCSSGEVARMPDVGGWEGDDAVEVLTDTAESYLQGTFPW